MDSKKGKNIIDESTLTITHCSIKPKASKELIQEILTIFSMPTLPTSPIMIIDQILIRNILSTKPEEQALSTAAILLNFQSCLNIEINETIQLGEVLRKMISFGFFASQIYEMENFSNELRSLILYISNHLKNSNLNVPQCSMATAFLLSCVSPFVPKISLFSDMSVLQNILDIYINKKVLNNHVITYFFDFFLAVFLSLTFDKELEKNEFQTFSTMMKIFASTVMTQFTFDFDEIKLSKKILEYISNHYVLISTRDELFNLLISLSAKYQKCSSILVEPANCSKVSNFISDYLKLVDFDYELKKGSNPIDLDTKVTNTLPAEFAKPFQIKDEISGEYKTVDNFEYVERKEVLTIGAISEPGEIEPIKKVEKISMTLQGLIQRISNLCRSINAQNTLPHHLQFMSSFLRSEGARIPIGVFFIDLWAKNISFISPPSIAESFHNCKFYQTALELAFFDYDDPKMRKFLFSFVLFIASFSPLSYSYIVDMINIFQNAIISVKICPDLCDLIVKCLMLNKNCFCLAMKCSNFDILMADDLYFYFNNCQNIETVGRTAEESKRLMDNYNLLLRFLSDIMQEPQVFDFLLAKNDFLISVLHQFFCPTTAEFAFRAITKIILWISNQKDAKEDGVASPILRTIFKFFATKLFKTPGMPASVLNLIIQFCTTGFELIQNQFGVIFRESHFFDIVVNLAIEENLQNSIQALLNLFVKVTTSKKYSITPNIELFLKLSPMIKSRGDTSVDDFLLKIIFDDDKKMTKPRKIVNPGPLSLLFQIYQDNNDKFIEFLKFVSECLKISAKETVQTDFITQLIRYLQGYRYKTEKDEQFDLVLGLLTDIMTISITQKDMLAFFQLFTSTKDNIRPFFTGYLLKALTSAIDNYQATSRSFFSLDEKGKITLPPISSDVLNSDFSIIMKIELHNRTGSIFRFTNPLTGDVIELSFTDVNFLSLNGQQHEIILTTFKFIILVFTYTKNSYSLSYNNNIPLIQVNKKKELFKNDLTHNVIGGGLDANIEFIKIVYTNKSNRLETLYEFKAASFYEDLAIFKSEVAKVDCPIFHLPPSLLEVLTSIGGVQVILPIFNQIEQPTNATNPDPNENLLALALKLLSTILNKDRQLQIDFYSIDGFKLVSELLTLISINKFNQPVFDEIFNLFNIITEPDLQNQMIESILFDLGTWVYIPDIVPLFFERCFNVLHNKIISNKAFASYSCFNIQSLLFLIRCHLFASTNKNNSICLSETEKKTFAGNTFAERQTVKNLRDNFMKFIYSLCPNSDEDFKAILFFCLDDQDEIFQRSSIKLLKTIISNEQNPKIKKFIPKLPYKELIELFRNSENRKTSFQLFSFMNSALSNKCMPPLHKKMIIAKTILEFNLYPISISAIKLISQNTSDDYRIALTLYLLTLLIDSNQTEPSINIPNKKNQNNPKENSSEQPAENTNENANFLSDKNVLEQIVNSYKELTSKISKESFVNNEVFFIIFLLHTFLDRKKYETIFKSLLEMTMDLWLQLEDPFGFLHKFIETLEFRAKFDFADFLRKIYTAAISRTFPKPSIELLFINNICRFLFEIPSFDSYSNLFRFPQPSKPISFHDLFSLANNDSIPFSVTYHYSLRINDNCKWMDFELATLFLEKYLTNSISKTSTIEQMSYIVGNGIIYKSFLSYAEKLIELLKTVKDPKTDNDNSISKTRRNAIIFLLGSLSRQILRGACNYKNDESTPYQLLELFKISMNQLNLEISLILKEKLDSNDYLSTFSMLIAEVETKYENRLLSSSLQSGNNLSVDASNSSNSAFTGEQEETQGTYTTANDPYCKYADLTQLENGKQFNINLEQYQASLSNYVTASKKLKLQSLKRYKQLYSQLNCENGPWMTPEMPPELHYKLYNTTTRTLLVPNLKFNDHKEASLARDLGSYENAQAILKEQISKMKMKTFSTDFSLIDFKDDANENEDNKQSAISSSKNNEEDLMICQSQLVTPRKLHSGNLNLTLTSIIFNSKNKYVRIKLSKIKKILLRRYLMVDTAIEIFTSYSKVYFINFIDAQERLKFLTKVSSLKVPSIKFIQKKWEDVKLLLKKLIKKWQDGLISNFDYLMKINILAGRSFNDLSQYPVFPWVIKDYKSERLNLNNPEIYRCFSKPIGAIGQQRLEQMREKMEQGFGDETKYLYGALYSSPAVVIGYLIRMEPFTSLHVQLQSNRFDVGDRLFISIPSAYESVTTSQMDFRELIPEFFINPDFLVNSNNFDLGISVTSGMRINDVILPPWAKDSRQFIEINRMALESQFVTMNIHQWIDLIFGPHSRPPYSFEVDNVFSPAFYETSLENADEFQVTYLKECAACFGCACLQIFDEFPEGLAVGIKRNNNLGQPKSYSKIAEFNGKSILALNSDKNDIVAVTSDLQYLLNETKGKLSCQIPPSVVDKAFPMVSVNGKRKVAVALKWSNAVNVYNLKNYNNPACEPWPYDSLPSSFASSDNVVTAISISNNFLAVAFSDFTLRVFKLTRRPPASLPLNQIQVNSSASSNSLLSNSNAQLSATNSGSIGGQTQQTSSIASDSDASAAEMKEAENATVNAWNSFTMKRQVGFLSKHSHTILFTTVSEKVGAVFSISSDGFLSSMSLTQGGRYLKGVNTGFYDPSHFIISKSGFIVIAFNGPDTANIVVYDQNLEKIAAIFHEAAVQTWTVAESCGDEILLVVNKRTGNGQIARMRLPFLVALGSFNTDQQVSAISFIKKPYPKIAIGFETGTVASANLE